MAQNPGMAKRVAYNTVVQFIGRIVGAALAITVTRLVAEHLGVAGYGRYVTIFAYVTFFGAIADFGFFWYLVREVAKNKANAEKITANVITLRLIFALVVLAIGAATAYAVPRYDPTVRLGIVLLAVSTVWVSLSNTLIGVFQAYEQMRYPVVNEVIGRTVTLILTYIVIRSGFGLLPIVLAALCGSLVIFLLNYAFAGRFTKIRLGFDLSMWRQIMKENLSLGINVLLGIIYFKVDSVILSALKPSLDVGIYGAPYKILEILLAFPAMFMGAVFPTLAQVINKDAIRTNRILQKTFDLLAIAGWGVTVGAIVLATPIIAFTTKGEPDFLSLATIQISGIPITAPVVMQILAVAVGFAFIGNFFVGTIVAQGSQRLLIMSNTINVAVNVGLNLLLIPLYSYLAAAVITIVSEIIVIAFASMIVYQKLRFIPRLKTLFMSGIAAGLMGLTLFYIRPFVDVITATIIGGIIYVALLFLTGSLTKDMLTMLFSRGVTPEESNI